MKFINCRSAHTHAGWENDIQIGVDDEGRIDYVGPQRAAADEMVDLILPAPTNLHSHTFQRAMSGLTEGRGPSSSDSFWTWRQLMYKFLDRLTPDHVEAVASLAFMEMLEAGYSSVAEFHYIHHAPGGEPYAKPGELADRIIAASEKTGIGLTLLPVFYEYGGCDRKPLESGQLRFKNDVDRYQQLHAEAARSIEASHDDYRLGVAPHSLRAVDEEGLKQLLALSGDGPVHMHIAEQIAEVEEVKRYHGARPVEWLLANHDVGEAWCLIHCTQMNDAETRDLAGTGAVAGLCPITESSLGDGIFNGVEFLGSGGRAGVGSDSNIHISLFDELKTLEYSQRLRDRSRATLATNTHSTGRLLFDTVSKGGAQASHRPTGAIEEGMLADMIGLSTDNQWIGHLNGDALLDGLIFGGFGQTCVTDVWSAGRHVVSGGKHNKNSEIVAVFRQTMSEIGEVL